LIVISSGRAAVGLVPVVVVADEALVIARLPLAGKTGRCRWIPLGLAVLAVLLDEGLADDVRGGRASAY
jgi:hypothetical protein